MSIAPSDSMIRRFSLYGFLKNQQYYEPFFLLVLLTKGLDYFQIGLLYSFREVWVQIMGIPAGFLADLYGRRRSLLVCFVAYMLSFIGFAWASSLALLYLSMFFFAVGESFRSGTHKAMVFHYLKLHGMEAQKVRVYGLTRSWSKIGSALSSLLSGLLVLVTGSYSKVFLFSIIPYALNSWNVARYPAQLEGESQNKVRPSLRSAFRTMLRETWILLRHKGLRRIFLESSTLQVIAKTVRNYVQPLVVTALAASLWADQLLPGGTVERTALVLGLLYFFINTVAAAASRYAHLFAHWDSWRVSPLWLSLALLGGLMMLGVHIPGATGVAVLGFMLLVLIENIWRPIFLDRLDQEGDSRFGAAVLSVEAQLNSLGVMIAAPLLGLWVDYAGLGGVGVAVGVLSLIMLLMVALRSQHTQGAST